jgi:hypothetical protein
MSTALAKAAAEAREKSEGCRMRRIRFIVVSLPSRLVGLLRAGVDGGV